MKAWYWEIETHDMSMWKRRETKAGTSCIKMGPPDEQLLLSAPTLRSGGGMTNLGMSQLPKNRHRKMQDTDEKVGSRPRQTNCMRLWAGADHEASPCLHLPARTLHQGGPGSPDPERKGMCGVLEGKSVAVVTREEEEAHDHQPTKFA
ncbi:hypothetical protein Bbelb_074090 [Branchiostoma belcheri]|nr:hypothetical protein Bbelb_074090 [Branchiostoma belcheri]